jgi:hypothetical protein
MKDSGPVEVLMLFALLYCWMLYNVAAIVAKRFKRFSFRTMLIGITLANVALGLAVYALRK